MPRRQNRKTSKRKTRLGPKRGSMSMRQGSEVVSIPFRATVLQSISVAASGTTVAHADLNPVNLGGRLDEIAAEFSLFRFRKLKLTTMFDSTPVGFENSDSVGFLATMAYSRLGSADLNTISSLAQLSQFDVFKVSPNRQISMAVTGAQLQRDQGKWYRVTGRNTPAYDEAQQGTLWWAVFVRDPADLTVQIDQYTIIEGVCDFTGRVDSAVIAPSPPRLTISTYPRLLGDDEKERAVLVPRSAGKDPATC